MESKKCTRCQIIKPVSCFNKDSTRGDGRQYTCKQCRNEHSKNRRQYDEYYRLTCCLRSRLYNAVKAQCITKNNSTMQLVGCTPQFLAIWLEFTRRFYCPSSLNYHIEHLRPCASFDLRYQEEQIDCFNWRNLRLYDATENLSKHDRYPTDEELIVHQKLIYSFLHMFSSVF